MPTTMLVSIIEVSASLPRPWLGLFKECTSTVEGLLLSAQALVTYRHRSHEARERQAAKPITAPQYARSARVLDT